MDKRDICKTVVSFHRNILGAVLIEQGDLIASHIKPLTPLPEQDRFRNMILQTHALIAIPQSNEDFFGKVGYLMINHENMDVFIFPLILKYPARVLAFSIRAPYNHEKLIQRVSNYLKMICLKENYTLNTQTV